MTDDTWAREKAREIITERYGSNDVRLADLITAALLSARLAGWREGREDVAEELDVCGIGDGKWFAEKVRAMPEPEEKVT